MELMKTGDFLQWAAVRGIVPDPTYQDWPDQAPLTYTDIPSLRRRWLTPEGAFNLPNFAWCLLGCAAPDCAVFLLVKGGAPWFTNSIPGVGPEWEHLRDRIVGTLPIPRDFSGALKVAKSEYHDVVLLMVTFLVYAWCVADDLQIVPEDGAVIMETSHHGEVLVQFPGEERMNGFVKEMSECGFPAYHEDDAG